MEEGVIAKWRVQEGAFVNAGDVLFEVATDKATVEHSALDAGYLRKILVPEGGEARVNQSVAIFTEKADESIEGYKPEGLPPKPAEAAPVQQFVEEGAQPAAQAAGPAMRQPDFAPEPPLAHYDYQEPSGHPFASPLARKLARERGIDLTTVRGSGPNQRIVSRDLDLGQPAAAVVFGRRETPSLPPGTYEEERLTPMRKVIGQRLQESKTFIPHFYTAQDIRADALCACREQLKNVGVKVSVNDFVVRATALALREHPEINSGYHAAHAAIIRFKTIDVCIAVSIPAGLVTPIVRHADFKNLGQLSVEARELASRARQGKLQREEYAGGSFTISNLGMYGISDFAGVINPPQAAILCVGGIEDKPVVSGGCVVPGKEMRLILAADHRVIDGADAARFLKTVQKYLENPSALLV
jgi:pyruvate dehydrogenase E2 component (dihydrolipoamide acetyltransferase)